MFRLLTMIGNVSDSEMSLEDEIAVLWPVINPLHPGGLSHDGLKELDQIARIHKAGGKEDFTHGGIKFRADDVMDAYHSRLR